MLTNFLFIFCIIVGYLVGSFCSAVIVCRLFDLPDPRSTGSQNPGATNVLRIAGKKYAAIVLLTDMLKGFIPVLFASLIGAGSTIASFTCLAAVVGHIYPVFFNFKGGKGIATAFGGLLALHFILGISIIGIWLLVANFSHYSSLASITAISLAPIFALYFLQSANPFIPLFAVTLLILYQHRQNINRLMAGTESKIVLKKPIIQEEIEEQENPTEANAPQEPQNNSEEEKAQTKEADSEKKPKKAN